MGDNLNVEEGAVPEPQEQVSKSIDESTKKLLIDLGGKYEALQKELRGLQGRQDKTESAFKTQFAEYDRLIKKGMSHDEAVETLENKQKETSTLTDLQKRLEDLAKRLEGGQPATASQEVVQAFEELGLDVRDPAVIIEMQKYRDLDSAVAGAYRFKKSMSKAPGVTSAQTPALTSVPKSVSMETLKSEYIKEVSAVRGNRSLVKGVQAKFRERGLNVDSIGFSV